MKPHKTRMEIWLTKVQKERLKALAAERACSIADIIRRGIELIEKELIR